MTEVEYYRGWARPGPTPPGGVDIEPGESLDFLCGHFRIFQYEKGHRYSVDDALCAYYGSSYAPRVDRYCDIGSGISSIANIVAWRLPGCRVVTIEAQEMSLRLAKKTARYNGIVDRLHPLHGDLRDDGIIAQAIAAGGPFDLVTGSPPYWPVGAATAANHPQAIPARLEVRGDVRDYALSAAKLLAPGGVFACVHQAAQDERVEDALDAADLVLVRKREVCFKEGVPAKTSGIALYLAARRADLPKSFLLKREGRIAGKPLVESPLILRRTDGSVHPEYASLKLSYGFPPGDVGANP